MTHLTTERIVQNAFEAGIVVPALNIPYLPMMAPIVEAIRETNSFALIQVARPEWEKFEAKSLGAVREEYERRKDLRHTRLHLDHVPVIDEDNRRVDFIALLEEAIDLGYESLMVDGSRLPLDENIEATKRAVALARDAGVPIEAELGAVLGHEEGPLPPYDELFESGRGFTDPDEAARFVEDTAVDWLSVAIGNIHGAISGAAKSEKKVQARLNIDRLDEIRSRTEIPLVLHGGSGIRLEAIRESFGHGIAKINIGTALRQPYEKLRGESITLAQDVAREVTKGILENDLQIAGRAETVNPQR